MEVIHWLGWIVAALFAGLLIFEYRVAKSLFDESNRRREVWRARAVELNPEEWGDEDEIRYLKIRNDKCPECGGELDTGWECSNCGFDALPEKSIFQSKQGES